MLEVVSIRQLLEEVGLAGKGRNLGSRARGTG